MLSKYRIVLSEIYNQYIHGDGEPMINSHYLIIGKFNHYYESYYSDDELEDECFSDYQNGVIDETPTRLKEPE